MTGRNRIIWLALTLILFAASLVTWFDVATLALLVCVLLLHESGHYVGMLLFGYRPGGNSLRPVGTAEAGFLLFAAAGFGGVAWWWSSWILGLLAAGVLIAVPIRYERTGLRAKVLGELPRMTDQLEDLTEHQQRELFLAARTCLPSETDPRQLATVVRELHGEAVQRPAPLGVVAGLLLLFAAGTIGGPWLHTQITWTWGKEPRWNAQFREMVGEARQLAKRWLRMRV